MPHENTGKKLRILHVTEAAAGGVLRHLEYVLPGLQSRDCSCACLIFSARADAERLQKDFEVWRNSGIPANFLSLPEHWLLRADCWRMIYHALRRMVKEFHPEVIHFHSSKAGGIGRILTGFLPGKFQVIYSPHAFFWHRKMNFARRWMIAAAEYLLAYATDRFVLVGPGEVLQGTQMHLPWKRKHEVIQNGLPLQWRSRLLSRENARQLLGIPSGEFAVAVPGRFCWQKGQDLLLEMLAAQPPPENCRFHFYGDGISRLSEGGISAAVAKCCVFREEIPDLDRCYCAFDLGVLPSRYEGLSYVLLEMLAAGLPVLAGASQENIRIGNQIPDGAGQLLLWKNTADFEILLKQCSAENRCIGAGKMIPQIFSLDRQLARLAKLYRDACGRNGK